MVAGRPAPAARSRRRLPRRCRGPPRARPDRWQAAVVPAPRPWRRVHCLALVQDLDPAAHVERDDGGGGVRDLAHAGRSCPRCGRAGACRAAAVAAPRQDHRHVRAGQRPPSRLTSSAAALVSKRSASMSQHHVPLAPHPFLRSWSAWAVSMTEVHRAQRRRPQAARIPHGRQRVGRSCPPARHRAAGVVRLLARAGPLPDHSSTCASVYSPFSRISNKRDHEHHHHQPRALGELHDREDHDHDRGEHPGGEVDRKAAPAVTPVRAVVFRHANPAMAKA